MEGLTFGNDDYGVGKLDGTTIYCSCFVDIALNYYSRWYNEECRASFGTVKTEKLILPHALM